MKIAVVGATGMVGSRVVAEAARRGHDQIAVFRSRQPTALPPGVPAGTSRFVTGRSVGSMSMKDVAAQQRGLVSGMLNLSRTSV